MYGSAKSKWRKARDALDGLVRSAFGRWKELDRVRVARLRHLEPEDALGGVPPADILQPVPVQSPQRARGSIVAAALPPPASPMSQLSLASGAGGAAGAPLPPTVHAAQQQQQQQAMLLHHQTVVRRDRSTSTSSNGSASAGGSGPLAALAAPLHVAAYDGMAVSGPSGAGPAPASTGALGAERDEASSSTPAGLDPAVHEVDTNAFAPSLPPSQLTWDALRATCDAFVGELQAHLQQLRDGASVERQRLLARLERKAGADAAALYARIDQGARGASHDDFEAASSAAGAAARPSAPLAPAVVTDMYRVRNALLHTAQHWELHMRPVRCATAPARTVCLSVCRKRESVCVRARAMHSYVRLCAGWVCVVCTLACVCVYLPMRKSARRLTSMQYVVSLHGANSARDNTLQQDQQLVRYSQLVRDRLGDSSDGVARSDAESQSSRTSLSGLRCAARGRACAVARD